MAMTRAQRERLIVEHMPLVRKVARQVAPQFSPALQIQDFEQDGMVGLCEAAAGCTDTRTFGAFAYFRIRGSMVDAHRRQQYREELNPSADALDLLGRAGGLAPAAGEADPEEALAQARSGIWAAVAKLPVRHQRVMMLRYMLDLTVEETGRRLGASASLVRQLHNEAIEMLRPAAEKMR